MDLGTEKIAIFTILAIFAIIAIFLSKSINCDFDSDVIIASPVHIENRNLLICKLRFLVRLGKLFCNFHATMVQVTWCSFPGHFEKGLRLVRFWFGLVWLG